MKLTQEQIEEIRKRAEAATIGDWDYDVEDFDISNGNFMVLQGEVRESEGTVYAAIQAKEIDLRFICEAREDIPALLAHIAELEKVSLEILENYKYAEQTVLNDRSVNFGEDYASLEREIADYRKQITGEGDANAES